MWWPMVALPMLSALALFLYRQLDRMDRTLTRKTAKRTEPVNAIADFRSYKRERRVRDVREWRAEWRRLAGGEYCGICKGTHRDGTHGGTLYERNLGSFMVTTAAGSRIRVGPPRTPPGPPRNPPADMIEYRIY